MLEYKKLRSRFDDDVANRILNRVEEALKELDAFGKRSGSPMDNEQIAELSTEIMNTYLQEIQNG